MTQPNWYFFEERWHHVLMVDGRVYLDGASIGSTGFIRAGL